MTHTKIAIALSFFLLVMAHTHAVQGNQLTATQILDKVDAIYNAPKDRTATMKLILIDNKGNEEVREITMLQKGSDKRLAKFLSPPEQKGIGFLSLPDGVMYIYLPEYKKTRRIASHVKNTKFAGTDFTYEDMEAKRLSDDWNPELEGSEGDHYILSLKPKEGIRTDYARQRIWVDKEIFYPVRMELYDRGNNLRKVMTAEDIEQMDGYWIARVTIMEDLKTDHKTKMILEEVEYDSGIEESTFTERYLEK
jgi:outer membrane lipoprotein-sorting protein